MAARSKKAPRSARRSMQEHAAAQVMVPARCDVCVVGGGASGLACAAVASERGARVVVLERDLECGRKILATGNGRCNFANASLNSTLYHGGAFVAEVCGDGWLDDVLGFFADCDLAWTEESEGRLYPISRQASSVRNVLLGRATRAGALLAPAREVVNVAGCDDGIDVTWRDLFGTQETHVLHARAVVLAAGGANDIAAEHLGLVARPFEPTLCPIACTGPALSSLDGRRVRAMATLVRDGNVAASECGEVLFRDYGLSGIAVFNLSRHARQGDVIRLDLLPTLDEREARALSRHTLDGILDPVISQALVAEGGNIEGALRLAKRLEYVVEGLTQTEKAQVSRGGLATDQFVPSTLAARCVPSVFACGEALDVDGPCGGFNLAWAWKSGMVAGAAADTAMGAATNPEGGSL